MIALDHNDEGQRRQVAALVSNHLNNILKNNIVVAVGQGRNVAAVAEFSGTIQARLPLSLRHRRHSPPGRYHQRRSAIGCLLAKKFGGSSESLYAPAYVENMQLKELLLQNGTIKETLDRARKADIALVGIGDMNEKRVTW